MSDLEKYISTFREAEQSGEIRISKEITDFDLMIHFAIGRLAEKHGVPLNITVEDIFNECTMMGDYANKLLNEEVE